MYTAPPRTHLRTHRRVWGLTQKETSLLLGLSGPFAVSRLESPQRKRGPSYETALACHVLFGLEPRDLFPSIHRQVEERVIRACYLMHQGLENTTSLFGLRKREFLELVLKRATIGDVYPYPV